MIKWIKKNKLDILGTIEIVISAIGLYVAVNYKNALFNMLIGVQIVSLAIVFLFVFNKEVEEE